MRRRCLRHVPLRQNHFSFVVPAFAGTTKESRSISAGPVLASLVGVVLLGLCAGPVHALPKVVVSIKPIHSLVAGVMAGIAEPELIVAGGASPHTYSLKPSDAGRLEAADLVFWIGPIFEGFLVKPLAALAGRAELVELDRVPAIALLPARIGGAWEPDPDEPAQGRNASALEKDGHLWLDPANAKAIVRLAVDRLSARDPENAARYAANGAALEQRIDALDERLRQRLLPVQHVPFVVFHDAYHYLEHRYGLAAIGSITVDPEHRPGAKRLQAIRAKVLRSRARCVFSEPQFEPRLVQTVIAGTGADTGVLDPEGAALSRGPDLYFVLMDRLADALVACLGRPS
jgi:zinc transport system substrate-binding protein